ncbi:MAG: ATP-binding protein [Planctomycetes bacterium]|nr:ATP-binding protein [Planctomycetota bacterium]
MARRDRGQRSRGPVVAAACIIAAVAALAALGVILAHRASHEAENAIRWLALEVARDRASAAAGEMRRRAREAIARISKDRHASSPIIGIPFATGADGRFTCPFPAASEDALLAFEPLLSQARTLEAMGKDPIEAIAAYRSVADEGPDEALRLQARAAEASALRKAGKLAESIAVYEEILREPIELQIRAAPPTPLQVRLALLKTLEEAGRTDERVRRAQVFVEEAAGGAVPASAAERAFFFDEVVGPDAPPSLASVRNLADRWVRIEPWLEVTLRERDDGGEALEAESRGTGGQTTLAFWQRMDGETIGFVADPAGIREALGQAVSAGEGQGIRFDVVGADASDFVAFPAPFGGWGLALPAEERSRLVGSARSNRWVFSGLAALLAAVSALALVAVVRGVREGERLSRMRTELVAGVSHELKTPLALLRLYAESLILGRVADPEKREEYLRTIVRETGRLTHLVDNVMAFARIEAGGKASRREPLEPGEIVRETVEAYRAELDRRGFRIEIEIAPDLPEIEADRDAIAQALINLLDNAAKYSPDGRRIAVRARGTGASVRLEVEDEGIGIRPEDIDRIFDPFHRSDEARALGTRGSGLGLALVRSVAQAHGGRVDVKSEAGRGSVFALVIPAGERGRNADDPGRRG